MEEQVILVNENDSAIGEMSKMKVHELGILHRAFSVFIFNDHGELLLQQRSLHKYHSEGLWTNTCCGHPRPGEETRMAAQRRLGEEMGIETDLSEVFSFIYRTEFANGLIEQEFDHVFFGSYSSDPDPDPSEVMSWRYVPVNIITSLLIEKPSSFSFWMAECWPKILPLLR